MPDLHWTEADGRLLTCENCMDLYLERQPGDMADLNSLCRKCAEECTAQLSIDYNLPLGCSDEERQLALNPPEDLVTTVFRCVTLGCSVYGRYWSTILTDEQWRSKYGRPHHCFRCGIPSIQVRSWGPNRA